MPGPAFGIRVAIVLFGAVGSSFATGGLGYGHAAGAAPVSAGIIRIDAVRQSGLARVATLYADDVACSASRREGGEPGGFFLACRPTTASAADLWFAFSRDGRTVTITPLNSAASDRLDAASPVAPDTQTRPRTEFDRLTEPLRAPLEREARDAFR